MSTAQTRTAFMYHDRGWAMNRLSGAFVLISLVLTAGASIAQAPPIDFKKFSPWKQGAGDGDYVIGPPYAPAPELTPRSDVAKGTVHHFTMDSLDSLRYPGISKTERPGAIVDRKSTRLNSSHTVISY